jgi:TonB family protein
MASSPQADQASATDVVRLSEILISTPQPYDPAQVAEAHRKAEQARAAIGRDGTFADTARANSQGPTAAQGGDLGCFTHDKLAQALDEVVFRMKVGDVSDVLRTKQGFVILEVTDRGAHCADLQLLNQPMSAELKPYLDTLIKKVHERWYKLIPKSARSPEMKQGNVTIEFSIQRNGAIVDQKVFFGSGDVDLDEAALNAIREASPLSPLPDATKTDHLLMRLTFRYNPAKATV